MSIYESKEAEYVLLLLSINPDEKDKCSQIFAGGDNTKKDGDNTHIRKKIGSGNIRKMVTTHILGRRLAVEI